MKKLLAILWASIKTVSRVLALFACLGLIYVPAYIGVQLALAGGLALRIIGVFLLAMTLVAAMYALAVIKSRGPSAVSPLGLPAG